MNPDDPFQAQQDAVASTLDGWPKSKRLEAYKYLYALGYRISDIDFEIRKAWKAENDGR